MTSIITRHNIQILLLNLITQERITKSGFLMINWYECKLHNKTSGIGIIYSATYIIWTSLIWNLHYPDVGKLTKYTNTHTWPMTFWGCGNS